MSNQSTAVSVYGSVPNAMEFIEKMGMSIAKSQMFGCQNPEQGMVLAAACLTENKSPVEIARKYHIIQGNLSKKSDAMLAEFRERGGKHNIIQRDSNAAEIELTMDGNSIRFRFEWDEAQNESYVWGKADKEGNKKLKDNWATPRGRMQMLWARVVSDGVRAVCPEIVAGTYTPEEVQDFEGVRGNVIDAEFEIVEPASQEESVVESWQRSKPCEGAGVNGFASDSQWLKIEALFEQLQIPHEQRESILQKRGVNSVRSLTEDAARQLIQSLADKLASLAASEPARQAEGKVSEPANGPISQTQIDRIKHLISEACEFDAQAKDKIVARLAPRKLADLNRIEAEQLISGLMKKIADNRLAISAAGE